MFNQPVELQFTSSGHYCIDIIGQENQDDTCESEVLIIDNNMDNKEKKKILIKLHKQFGHCSSPSRYHDGNMVRWIVQLAYRVMPFIVPRADPNPGRAAICTFRQQVFD